MKKTLKLLCQTIVSGQFIIFTIAISGANGVFAQEKQSITGKLAEVRSEQAVSYATVALIKLPDSKIAGGTMSDENGVFNIGNVVPGNYTLQVTCVGYKPSVKNIEVKNDAMTDAGIIMLQDSSIILNELVVVGERIKARSESDKTTFFVTQKMLDVSNTGTDVLKLVPGIQVDLMQNISLEGSPDILIYVDGKERDKSFISQLSPDQIDQIEVISVPRSNYDGNATGAINVILKKDRDSGINGHILAEIPLTLSEVYIFPSYSLNYSIRKLNLYTSYNGEMVYLDLNENTSRRVWNDPGTNDFILNQNIRQKHWSHKFHYGFDYFLSDRDQFNFYAFFNPRSRELDGNALSQMSGTINDSWQAIKEDTDHNTSTFYSLYYKHSFNRKGSEITADISNYSLKAENRTDYTYTGDEDGMISYSNAVKPGQNSVSIKLDFKTLFLEKLSFSTGVKARLQKSKDIFNDFEYNENIFAVYGNVAYEQENYDFSFGLRTERSVAELKDNFRNPDLVLLPGAAFRYKLTSKQNIQLSYNSKIKRPDIYQLNPGKSFTDPYAVTVGNPLLTPELTGTISLDHSIQFNGNYLASRLFWSSTTNAINNLIFVNDSNILVTEVQNLGIIKQFGLQFSGTFKLSILTINPYLKIFNLHTSGNDLARYYSIGNRNCLAVESGLSAIVSFKHEIAFSLTMQYNSARNDIQSKTFSDMLYFLSLEKTFKRQIKIGLVSALPFNKTFTYQGSETTGPDFQSHYEGNVKMSAIPLWIKIGYQFNSGKNRKNINREKEETDIQPKKGF